MGSRKRTHPPFENIRRDHAKERQGFPGGSLDLQVCSPEDTELPVGPNKRKYLTLGKTMNELNNAIAA